MASCQMRLLVCGDDDDMFSLKEVNKCLVRNMATHWGENTSIPMYFSSINKLVNKS
jgi:hypothetical protein